MLTAAILTLVPLVAALVARAVEGMYRIVEEWLQD